MGNQRPLVLVQPLHQVSPCQAYSTSFGWWQYSHSMAISATTRVLLGVAEVRELDAEQSSDSDHSAARPEWALSLMAVDVAALALTPPNRLSISAVQVEDGARDRIRDPVQRADELRPRFRGGLVRAGHRSTGFMPCCTARL